MDDELERQIREDRENYQRTREDHEHTHEHDDTDRTHSREVASSIAPAYRTRSERLDEAAVTQDNMVAKLVQVVYYIAGILVALVALRFLLLLFGAANTGIVNLVYQLTDPLVAPFQGLFSNVSVEGGARLELASLFAILAILILAYIVAGFFRLLSRDTTP